MNKNRTWSHLYVHQTRTMILAPLFLFCIWGHQTKAENVYDPGSDPSARLADLHDRGFIGGPNDTSALVSNVVSNLNTNIPACSSLRLRHGVNSLDLVLAEFYENWPEPEQNSLKQELLTAIERARYAAERNQDTRIAYPESWKLDLNALVIRLTPNLQLNFDEAFLRDHCSDPGTPECRSSYSNAVNALRYAELTRISLTHMFRDCAVGQIRDVAELRNKQWDAYFAGIPQWPWEMAFVNGPIYGCKIKDEKGLAEPPTWQLIVAHPDIAFEYVKDAEDGDQFKPALLVEVLGVNFWSWKENGKQDGPWGIPFPVGLGVVALYSDRAGVDDWGWGGIVHINHIYNFGITDRDGDLGYFVSANISKLFEKVSDKKEKYFGN